MKDSSSVIIALGYLVILISHKDVVEWVEQLEGCVRCYKDFMSSLDNYCPELKELVEYAIWDYASKIKGGGMLGKYISGTKVE